MQNGEIIMKRLFDQGKRDIYPLELIKCGMELVWNTKSIRVDHYESIRPMLLYFMQEMPNGWLPLNREYKPLGVPYYGKQVEYEDYPFLIIPKEMFDITKTVQDRGFLFCDVSFPGIIDHKRAYFISILLAIPKLQESFDFKEEMHWKHG